MKEEDTEKKAGKNFIKRFFINPITINLGIMIVVSIVLVYSALLYIDYFTEHGEYKVVPDVEGMLLSDATAKIESEGFRWEVTDSVYNSDMLPGAVVDQNPKEGSKIKSARKLYISINALTPRKVYFPDVNEKSYRQGLSLLEGLGFKNIKIKKKSSPYNGLILYAERAGNKLTVGDRISINSDITLVVGDSSNRLGQGNALDEAIESMIDED